MTYKNLILITLNNTIHIKADNLEPVEVDSSCVNKLLNYTKKDRLGITGNLSSGWYIDIEKGLPISELSDRIEVREEQILLAKSGGYKEGSEIKKATIVNGKPYKITYKAFLLPVKEDTSHTDNNPHTEIVEKSYTIEEIERSIDKTFPHEYGAKVKKKIINNLKK